MGLESQDLVSLLLIACNLLFPTKLPIRHYILRLPGLNTSRRSSRLDQKFRIRFCKTSVRSRPRNQNFLFALPPSIHRPSTASGFSRCGREKHHSTSSHLSRLGEIRWVYGSRGPWKGIEAVQNHRSTAASHLALQTLYSKQLCRREESNYCELPAQRDRPQGL